MFKSLTLRITLLVGLLSNLLMAQTLSLQPGWNLVGASDDLQLQDMANAPEVTLAYAYIDGKWQRWGAVGESDLDFLLLGEGFWVKASGEVSLLVGANTHKTPIRHELLEDGSMLVTCSYPIERLSSISIGGESAMGKINGTSRQLFGNSAQIILVLSPEAMSADGLEGDKRVTFVLSDGSEISKSIPFPEEFLPQFVSSVDGTLYGYTIGENNSSALSLLANTEVRMEYTNDGITWGEATSTTDDQGYFIFMNLNAVVIRLFANLQNQSVHFYSRADHSPIPTSYHLGNYFIDQEDASRTTRAQNAEHILSTTPWLLSGSGKSQIFVHYNQALPVSVSRYESQRAFTVFERYGK